MQARPNWHAHISYQSTIIFNFYSPQSESILYSSYVQSISKWWLESWPVVYCRSRCKNFPPIPRIEVIIIAFSISWNSLYIFGILCRCTSALFWSFMQVFYLNLSKAVQSHSKLHLCPSALTDIYPHYSIIRWFGFIVIPDWIAINANDSHLYLYLLVFETIYPIKSNWNNLVHLHNIDVVSLSFYFSL